jgi:formamidopyrimidine-DNA glycosylase
LLAAVCERIAKFLMEQMIIAGGKFYADDVVWAEIMYGD